MKGTDELLYEKDKVGQLTVVSYSMIGLFFVELTGAIVICLYGVEESQVLTSQLYDVLIRMVYKFDTDPRAASVLKQIMEYVGCCGADGADDFIKVHKPVPWECREPMTGVEYTYGCHQQVRPEMQP